MIGLDWIGDVWGLCVAGCEERVLSAEEEEVVVVVTSMMDGYVWQLCEEALRIVRSDSIGRKGMLAAAAISEQL